MPTAKTAKSAPERARLAAWLLVTDQCHEREFDDCFEMGDGAKVYRLLGEMASGAFAWRLKLAMERHMGKDWTEKCIEAAKPKHEPMLFEVPA